ncbi:hypothetical protein LDH32_13600, partial [Mycobacterium tuberculosis]
TELIKPGKP